MLHAFPDARVTEVEEGWEDRWREFHHAVRIGPLWVGPPWEEPDADAVAIVIDPGRAFGTGAHPTTRLCLELLLEQEPGSVLDVGCGSGVLAIAAAKLGHGPVTGVDIEEAAVEATLVNAERNGVAVEARLAGGTYTAELALANISLSAIEGLRLDARRVITSGYLVADAPALPGHVRLDRRELDGWAADVHERG